MGARIKSGAISPGSNQRETSAVLQPGPCGRWCRTRIRFLPSAGRRADLAISAIAFPMALVRTSSITETPQLTQELTVWASSGRSVPIFHAEHGLGLRNAELPWGGRDARQPAAP